MTPSWYRSGMVEGTPRLLDLWDRHGIKVGFNAFWMRHSGHTLDSLQDIDDLSRDDFSLVPYTVRNNDIGRVVAGTAVEDVVAPDGVGSRESQKSRFQPMPPNRTPPPRSDRSWSRPLPPRRL
jgi:hypothetical protein